VNEPHSDLFLRCPPVTPSNERAFADQSTSQINARFTLHTLLSVIINWVHRSGCMKQAVTFESRYSAPFWRSLRGPRTLLVAALSLSFAACFLVSMVDSAMAAPKNREITSVDSIRRFMEKGQALFVAGQYAKSAEVFEAGYELHPYSAFLFNAGVAYEKADRLDEALVRFKKYIEVDPNAPDHADVEKRISKLEQAIADRAAAQKAGKKVAAATVSEEESATKSLVILETEPPGATVHFFRQVSGDAAYETGSDNTGYKLVEVGTAPVSASLDVGRYHVTVDKFGDYNPSESDLEVVSGRVHQLKLNLSQGAFMAYLRVSATPKNAQVFLDDPKREKSPWGETVPHGELVQTGAHTLLVTAPGYVPITRNLDLTQGQKENVSIDLVRVNFGTLRIDSNAPQITVTVDGRAAGTWTKGKPALLVENLSAGPHQVAVTSVGRKPLSGTLTVPKGQVQNVRANMVVTPPRGAAWTQAIIGGVLLGGGIYLGLESNRLYDELKSDRNAGILVRDDSRGTRGKVYSIGADVAFLGTAVLGGLSTYNFLKDPLPPSRFEVGKVREFGALSKTSSVGGRP